jgi:hypothetical protein
MDKYITGVINTENNIENLNKDYQKINNELLSFDPQSMMEIIQANLDPSFYDEEKYPDIKYYSLSNINNFNSFAKTFSMSEDNKKKYALINILINKDMEMAQNAINMKNLLNINNLVNLLLNIYSFKISREDAKKKYLKMN